MISGFKIMEITLSVVFLLSVRARRGSDWKLDRSARLFVKFALRRIDNRQRSKFYVYDVSGGEMHGIFNSRENETNMLIFPGRFVPGDDVQNLIIPMLKEFNVSLRESFPRYLRSPLKDILQRRIGMTHSSFNPSTAKVSPLERSTLICFVRT